MMVKQQYPHLVNTTARGHDLGKDILTDAAVIKHPLDAAKLSLQPFEPVLESGDILTHCGTFRFSHGSLLTISV